MSKKFFYIIDLNERGVFNAHVENEKSKEVFSLSNIHETFDFETGEETGEEYGEIGLVQDGYMKHGEDMSGLLIYLIDMKILPADATLVFQG